MTVKLGKNREGKTTPYWQAYHVRLSQWVVPFPVLFRMWASRLNRNMTWHDVTGHEGQVLESILGWQYKSYNWYK